MVSVQALELIIGILVVVTTSVLAYLLKKYGEISDQIIDEKITALNYIIPAVEQLIPVLPDKYQGEAQFLLELMKDMKTINEAIKNMPATARFKAWKGYKKTIETKLKLKQKLIEG
jgi:hypothetical protein